MYVLQQLWTWELMPLRALSEYDFKPSVLIRWHWKAVQSCLNTQSQHQGYTQIQTLYTRAHTHTYIYIYRYMGMWNSFHTPITLTILGIAIRNSFYSPFSCPVYSLPPRYLYSQVLLSSFFFHTLTSFPPPFHEPSMVSLTAYETPCSWTRVLHQYEPSLHHTTTETPESQPTRHSCSKDALVCVGSRSPIGEEHYISVLLRHSAEAWCTILLPNIMHTL